MKLITICLLCVLNLQTLAQELPKIKVPFKTLPEICKSASDRFLCEALELSKELLEQQVNCEVDESYTQKSWNGDVLTKTPDVYRVRVDHQKETYQKYQKNGLSRSKTRPDYQVKPVYASAGWFEKPRVILENLPFSKISQNKYITVYSFYAADALTLEHTEIWATRVLSNIYGEITFDSRSKLIRAIHFFYDITEKQREKHKFRYVKEEIVFDNPKGFYEENNSTWINKFSAIVNNGMSSSTEKDLLFSELTLKEGASGSPAFNKI